MERPPALNAKPYSFSQGFIRKRLAGTQQQALFWVQTLCRFEDDSLIAPFVKHRELAKQRIEPLPISPKRCTNRVAHAPHRSCIATVQSLAFVGWIVLPIGV